MNRRFFILPIHTLVKCLLSFAVLPGGDKTLNCAQAQTLRVGLPSAPESLNFFGATDLWCKNILRPLLMPLYVRDPAGGGMIPWLAPRLP